MRSAIGVGVLTFYIVLVVAGAQDIVAQKLSVGIPSVTFTLRVLLFVLPAAAALFTWKTCRDLAKKGAREEDYPRPYPKGRTPYEDPPGQPRATPRNLPCAGHGRCVRRPPSPAQPRAQRDTSSAAAGPRRS